MSSVKSSSSLGDPSGKDGDMHESTLGAIMKMGYIKKLKTMKKKFFVIRGDASESSSSTARIEYYDSEKKWRQHNPPKRSILLQTCFNINRRVDTKHKYVIALYTKDDCFCLVFDTEEEMDEWLKTLLSLQQGEAVTGGEAPKPTFEHVWHVTVANRGLGNHRNILGPHLLCLTDKTLSLVKMNQNEKTETYEFSLMSIRRCGDMESFFYMEVGRSSCTGAGDLWMQTEDTNIARNMHAAILSAMSNNKEDMGPRPRTRSSSANEASKPISVLHRRQTHAGPGKTGTFLPTGMPEEVSRTGDACVKPPVAYCDHPASVPAHAQDNRVSTVGSLPGSFHNCHHYHHRIAAHPPIPLQRPSQRRHSVSAMSVTPASNGPTHQRTYSFPLSDPSALPPWETRRGSTGRVGKRSTNSRSSTNAGRERCDSMPSRARTTSEGHHTHAVRNVHLVPGHNRPHSMYNRGISYSPPVGSSPVSPASGACSTDSAGSSLSVDEEHNWVETEPGVLGLGRYGHSLTPDEPVIFEENFEDTRETPPWSDEKMNNYMPMDRSLGSLSLPIQNDKVNAPLKFSPNLSSSGFKSGSPSQASYMDMYSPCGSSPLDTVGAYMTMSPGAAPLDITSTSRYGRSTTASSASHSRASSLAEDGYVPMAPGLTDDGYIDMDPVPPESGTNELSPGNSSCSIASGTPSTDLRFSAYHLDKVSSFFPPSEEEEISQRPARCYSVGSRPSNVARNLPDLAIQSECPRARAFSVGSRAGKLGNKPLSRHVLTTTPPSGKHSSSAPLLSHSWSGSPTLRPPLYASGEPMDDLMEIDFSSNPLKAAKTRNNLRTSRGETPAGQDRLSVPITLNNLSPNNLGSSPSSSQEASDYMMMAASKSGELFSSHTPRVVSSPSSSQEASDYMMMVASKSGELVSTHTPKVVSSGPYVEMKPGFGADLHVRSYSASPPQSHITRNISVSPKAGFLAGSASPPTKILNISRKSSMIGNAPYVDTAGNVLSEPVTVTSIPVFPTTKNSDAYMDMRGNLQPQHFPSTPVSTYVGTRPSGDNFPMSLSGVRKPTSPIQEEYMEMNLKQTKQESNQANRSAPVDTPQPRTISDPKQPYVDMSCGPSSNRSLPPKSHGEDYMVMTEGRRRKEKRGSRKDKQRFSSQPIAIQASQANDVKTGSSASTSPIFSLSGLMGVRKNSSETTPKIPPGYLPLGAAGSASPGSSPYSSLRRSRNRKAARSKENSGSEINCGIPTPTGSTSGIFPFSLNSPGSPMKPLPGSKESEQSNYEYNRKCPVDASSGTVRISYPYPDGSSGSTPVTPDSSSSSEQPTPVNAETLSEMSKVEENHDYINYSPARRPLGEVPIEADEFREYAVMRPIAANLSIRKISAPAFGVSSGTDIQKRLSSVALSSPTPISTRPTSSPLVVDTSTPLKQVHIPSFRPIAINPSSPTLSDGSSSPKIISSSASANKGASLFKRQLSSTSASSTESGKSQDVSTKEGKGSTAVSRQLSNSSVKSLNASGEAPAAGEGSTSRPGSVSSERELHYASLDLAVEADESRSPRGLRPRSEATPSPGAGQSDTFTYAEIDFVKSESLKNCSASATRKV